MITFKKNDPLYQQIASFYEREITDGRLAPGDRIPATVQLAKQMKVNPDTIQQSLKLLMTRGLLERVPGHGTFVRKGINGRTIGIIFGKDLLSDREISFYGIFLEQFLSLLEDKGWGCRLFLTGRYNGFDTAFYQMKHAIENGEIRAVVEFCSNDEIGSWIKNECVIPSSQATFNIEIMIPGLHYLAERNCRKIVCLYNYGLEKEEWGNNPTMKLCHTIGLPADSINAIKCDAHYRNGYNAVKDLLDRSIPFDGLLSTNDVLFQGALYAMMEYGIKIPEQVKVITHANKGLEIFCHVPLTRLEVDPFVVASHIYDELITKLEGRKYLPTAIVPELITGKSCGE